MPETTPALLPRETVLHIRDTCLCLTVQRTARRLARRFDTVLRPFGLTNGQFSLMVALNQPEPPVIGRLAPFLGMDPSTLTAMVKPLARRGLLTIEHDPDDRRSRRLRITPEGVALMRAATNVWQQAHAGLDAALPPGLPGTLRAGLAQVAALPEGTAPAAASPPRLQPAKGAPVTEKPVKGPASYFPSIEKTYGRPITEWQAIIRAQGALRHMELVRFLKETHGMGHGHANALVAHTLAGDRS